MPIQIQPVNINFSQGVDTKTDPFQVPAGRFLSLNNSIFTKSGLLQKRNGFGPLTALPNDNSLYLTTFNGNLTAIGSELEAYIEGSKSWVNTGSITPASLSTLPLIRSNTNQSQADAAIAPNGYIITVFTDNVPVAGTNVPIIKFAVADSNTGQNITPPQEIPVNTGTPTGSARVFLLGQLFIIVFTNLISSTSHLQYLAVSSQTGQIFGTNTDIAVAYTPSNNLSWDANVVNNNLYIAYNTQAGGQAVDIRYLTNTLTLVTAKTFSGSTATAMSLTADIANPSSPIIWATFYNSGDTTTHTLAVDQNLNTILAPTLLTTIALSNITTLATAGILTAYEDVTNAYGYDSSIPTDYIQTITCSQSGTVGSASVLIRSVGLASKASFVDGVPYVFVTYQSTYQPTYFLINGSGKIISKFAYENGPGYYTLGLPNVTIQSNMISVPYLFKDLIQAVNKNTNVPSGSQVDGIYSQTGINLVNITLGISTLSVSELGSNLNISGGFIWAYDGYVPVEQGQFLYPDNVETTPMDTTTPISGAMTLQQYYYQVTYEWSDNQGNLFRSAPSIPVTVTLTGSENSVLIDVPTLRLTYKTANPVKIVIYRWSTGQQNYYQVTSIITPLLNDTTVDYVTFLDLSSDSTILGNNLIYTTGSVLENISPPASNLLTLFNNRLWLVDAEDTNLLWYSKQVIENTPVEMSDLLTQYIAPNTSVQGTTGPITAIAPMDDKLIIFKKDALGYINGIGPDNTGANDQYSDFVLINSVVGCANQNSIVFMPSGLMFQSDKGIWLLGRDLSTTYIGAPVEAYNSATVLSALTVPETNQVRFTLSSGITLMYDYYYQQWGTFTNIPATSSCVYNSLHTYMNDLGQVFQETLGLYLDNSNPVLLSFTSSWISLAGIQGYERFTQMLLLGQYYTPFKLNVQFAFDFNQALQQSTIVLPSNYSPPYGDTPLYGSGTPYSGPSQTFKARIYPQIQKVSSFQITINEIFDPSYGTVAGAGLTLSGMNLSVGVLKGARNAKAAISFG